MNNTDDFQTDDRLSNGSIWNVNTGIYDSAFVKQSEIQIYSNSGDPIIRAGDTINRNSGEDSEDDLTDSSDIFNPTPLPCLIPSLPPRSSSVESASGTSSNQQDLRWSPHHSPQRRDSLSDSVGMVNVDDQMIQPNFYPSTSSSLLPFATRRHSTSSCESSAANLIPWNPLDIGISPTPINPNYSHLSSENDIARDSDSKMIDEMMANTLNSLSFKERESINDEIHGIDVRNAAVKETPELLRKSFLQLCLELQKLRTEWVAFDRSQRLFGAKSYLNTDDTRLMFLRVDLFDVKKTAKRMCKYAELMHEIFGDFALQRRPYLSDLTDLELKILEAGGYQILQGRDRAGRRIVGNMAFDSPKEFDVRSRLRLSVYVILCLMEDVETQRKGAVTMSWWHNVNVDDFLIRRNVHQRIGALPIRVGAYHLCFPSENSSRVGKKSKTSTGGGVSSGIAHLIRTMAVISLSEIRPHIRFHSGSVVECFYALQSFGIHSDQIPVNSSSGKLKTKQHMKWMELRRLKEDSLKNKGHIYDRIIECPNQEDVLFGRGRPIMRHPGNAVLRSVVQFKLEEYANAKSKKETTDVTWEVVRALKGKFGARFLKEENIENAGLGWIEVSNETARQKVRIAFRDLRTKIMKSSSPENGEKSTSSSTLSCSAGKVKRKGESISPITTPSLAATSSSIATFKSSLRSLDSEQKRQESDSSTSAFLGMDGTDMKRPRLCF